MRKVVCPLCGETLMLRPEEVVLYAEFDCLECGAALEVVSEDPFKVKAVEEESTADDDDDDDDDDD